MKHGRFGVNEINPKEMTENLYTREGNRGCAGCFMLGFAMLTPTYRNLDQKQEITYGTASQLCYPRCF